MAALALTGCAATTQTTMTTATTTHAAAPVKSRTATRHHRRSHARRSRPHRLARSGLAVSRASSSAVQPQPRPGSCHARGSGDFSLPDRRCTPGALSPAVTQADISSTICRSGYTEQVRPPESVTEREKESSLAAYGSAGPLHAYEYDHLVPLELGGAPNDARNLWPEPGGVPNPKDELEDRLREMVCAGQLRLAEAQRQIAADWVALYHRLVR